MLLWSWHPTQRRLCDCRENGAWQLLHSFSSLAWPAIKGPGMTSDWKIFCDRAAQGRAQEIATAPIAPNAIVCTTPRFNVRSRSIHMHGDDVRDGGQDQQDEQRQMQDMP
jgi:hypothetical protein